MTHYAKALQYCREVLDGTIPNCKWVKAACQRHLDDLQRADTDPSYPYYFDVAAGEKPCKYIELLPHVKGAWASKADMIRLEPWQCFVITCLFGWKRRKDDFRRYRKAYIAVPRKNGKSILAGGIGDYMFSADGEYGAEVYCGATTEAQAWEVFKPAKLMLERTEKLRKRLGVQVNASNMTVEATNSVCKPVIGKPGDGASPHCGICDEYHEHDSDELVDTLVTGMGARLQPLLLVITTAGVNPAGPCRLMQSEMEKMLEGSVQIADTFAIIYTVDAEDDWQAPASLRKANPNYGVSVYEDYLLAQQADAIRDARKQNIFLIKHLNIWVTAKTAWMNMAKWRACEVPEPPGEIPTARCVAALDLSSKIDITGRILVWKFVRNAQDYYYSEGRFYLPEQRLEYAQHYQKWVAEGYLQTTPGSGIDYQQIQDDLVTDIQTCRADELAFDPWNAEQMAQSVGKECPGCTPVEMPMQVRVLSDPMKETEALILGGRLLHSKNPVMDWMMGNVVAKEDVKGNIYPNKERREAKIDGAVALIMAIARAKCYTPDQECGIW